MRGPFQVPRQLGVPTERRYPAALTAAARPRDQRRPALEEDPVTVPLGDDRRPDLPAVGADHADGVPGVWMPDVRDTLVDVADERGAVEGGPDEWIHVARGVVLAHPVIAVRVDPQPREGVDERPRVVACV